MPLSGGSFRYFYFLFCFGGGEREQESEAKRGGICCFFMLGPVFGRRDFSRISSFGPPDFSRICRPIFLIFVGKSAQRNPPGKSPAKSSKICTTKIPDTFLQRDRAKKWRGGERFRGGRHGGAHRGWKDVRGRGGANFFFGPEMSTNLKQSLG